MNTDFMLSTTPEICLALGARLRAQRLAQNLQQSELALRAGVSKLTILKLENKGCVTLHSFIQVVRALGLVDELAPLFALQPTSIAMMEAADAAAQRLRASARRKSAA